MKKLITAFLFLSAMALTAPAFAGDAHSTWCFHHPVQCQEQNRHRNWDRDDRWRHEHRDWDNDRWEREHGRRSWNWDNHHEEHHDWDHDHDRH